jgi:hypothetical protein
MIHPHHQIVSTEVGLAKEEDELINNACKFLSDSDEKL